MAIFDPENSGVPAPEFDPEASGIPAPETPAPISGNPRPPAPLRETSAPAPAAGLRDTITALRAETGTTPRTADDFEEERRQAFERTGKPTEPSRKTISEASQLDNASAQQRLNQSLQPEPAHDGGVLDVVSEVPKGFVRTTNDTLAGLFQAGASAADLLGSDVNNPESFSGRLATTAETFKDVANQYGSAPEGFTARRIASGLGNGLSLAAMFSATRGRGASSPSSLANLGTTSALFGAPSFGETYMAARRRGADHATAGLEASESAIFNTLAGYIVNKIPFIGKALERQSAAPGASVLRNTLANGVKSFLHTGSTLELMNVGNNLLREGNANGWNSASVGKAWDEIIEQAIPTLAEALGFSLGNLLGIAIRQQKFQQHRADFEDRAQRAGIGGPDFEALKNSATVQDWHQRAMPMVDLVGRTPNAETPDQLLRGGLRQVEDARNAGQPFGFERTPETPAQSEDAALGDSAPLRETSEADPLSAFAEERTITGPDGNVWARNKGGWVSQNPRTGEDIFASGKLHDALDEKALAVLNAEQAAPAPAAVDPIATAAGALQGEPTHTAAADQIIADAAAGKLPSPPINTTPDRPAESPAIVADTAPASDNGTPGGVREALSTPPPVGTGAIADALAAAKPAKQKTSRKGGQTQPKGLREEPSVSSVPSVENKPTTAPSEKTAGLREPVASKPPEKPAEHQRAGLTDEESKLHRDTRDENDLSTEEYAAKQRAKTKLKRQARHEKETQALEEAGVKLDVSITNPSDGSRNIITGWTKDNDGRIQVRIEKHKTNGTMETKLVTVLSGDTITAKMDDSVPGTTRYGEKPAGLREPVASKPPERPAAEPATPEPPSVVKTEAPPVQPLEKEPWQMTGKQWAEELLKRPMDKAEQRQLNQGRTYHKKAVSDALAAGKPVPAEVLADYPELQKSPNPVATPGKSADKAAQAEANIAPFVARLRTLSDKDLRAEEKKASAELNAWANGTPAIIKHGESFYLNPQLHDIKGFEHSARFRAVNDEIEYRESGAHLTQQKYFERWLSATIAPENRAEFLSDKASVERIKAQTNKNHLSAVERALAAGKPVPAEVLADYPDLQKPKAEEAPRQDTNTKTDPRELIVSKAIVAEHNRTVAALKAKNDAKGYDTTSSRYQPETDEAKFVGKEWTKKLLAMIDAKDADGLRDMFDLNDFNEGSKRAFEAITGIKLSKTKAERLPQIDAWAGVSTDERARREAILQAKREALYAGKDMEGAKRTANTLKVKMHDGRTLPGGEAVDAIFADGYNRLTELPKLGAAKRYALANDNNGQMIPLKTELLRYARMKIAASDAASKAALAERPTNDADLTDNKPGATVSPAQEPSNENRLESQSGATAKPNADELRQDAGENPPPQPEPAADGAGANGKPPSVSAGPAGGDAGELQPDAQPGSQPGSGSLSGADGRAGELGTTGSDGRPGSTGDERGSGDERLPKQPVKPAEKTAANAGNHVITDLDYIEKGGDKTKFRDNVTAIRILRTLSAEQRPATPEEQALLAKYVGWGRSAFSEHVFGSWGYGDTWEKWSKEREEIAELLSEDERAAARTSTLNAHYTHPRIAAAMWSMAQRLGFKGGKVHEPAVGGGVFFGTMPIEIRDRSALAATEMDELSAKLAQALYPGAKVERSPYQEAVLPDNFFDLVISNFPFADITIRADKYNKLGANLHDYFFLKSLGTVRPGGIVVAITSTGTMDKQNGRIREQLAQDADLVAAFRLPGGAFLKNAGTDVVTDLIILKKRGANMPPSDVKWQELKTLPDPAGGEPIPVNEYFAAHPENILGTLDRQSKMYGKGDMHVSATKDFAERLEKAIACLPENIYEASRPKPPVAREMVDASSGIKDYGFQVKDGKLWQRQGGEMVEIPAPAGSLRQMEKLLGLRDAIRQLQKAELTDASDEDQAIFRGKLNHLYEAYVKKYGHLHAKETKALISDDPDWPVLLSLEDYNPETKVVTKADIFSKRVLRPVARATKATDPQQAVGFSLNETGGIDTARIGELLGISEDEAERQLLDGGLAYRVPGGGLELQAHYLSGNVREKLLQAQAAARYDERFRPNVEALKKVIPEDKAHSEIDVRLGSPWVPGKDYQDFFAKLLDSDPEDISVSFLQKTGKWLLTLERADLKDRTAFNATYGTPEAHFLQVVQAAMDDKPIVLYSKPDRDGKRQFLADETAAANLKVEEVREAFRDWIWQDDARRARLHRYYNDTYNNIVETKHDGSWLQFPTLAPGTKPYAHQRDAVARVMQTRRMLAGHEVGTGKTLMYGLVAAKMKELGFAGKPALAVLKANIEQVTEEIQRAFPTLKILSTNESFDAATRRRTIARIASGDWDLVVMTHDNLNMMDVDKDVEINFINEEIKELEDVILAAQAQQNQGSGRGRHGKDRGKDKTTKQLEKLKERLKEKLNEALSRPRDPAVSFQQSGIDMLMVDEAHKYKSLPVYTTRGAVKGIPQARSDRATNLLMNTRWLMKNNPKAVVVFGTGTPIDNSMVELYNWQRYLQPDELTARGIESFDGWANTFGQTVTQVEPTAAGEFKPTSRFKKFTNLQELSNIVRQILDTRFVEDMPNIVRPHKTDQVVKAPMNEEQAAFMQSLAQRARNLKGKKVVKGGDNMLAICTDGRKAALHMGLVSAKWTDAKDSKVNQCIRNVLANYKADKTHTQMIFSDLGVNKTDWGFHLYGHIINQLVKGGIPRDKIIDFTKLKEGEERLSAIARLRNGEAVVGIGSTETMGTGVNAQKRLRWLHHLDAPMTPGRMQQRDGRGWRQGNQHKELGNLRYVAEGSLDSFIWSLINNKYNFIQQVLKHGAKVREVNEEDASEISPARVMAEATGNPDVLNAVELQDRLTRLEQKRRVFQTNADRATGQRDYKAAWQKHHIEYIGKLEKSVAKYESGKEQEFSTTISGKTYTKRDAALDKALGAAAETVSKTVNAYDIGQEGTKLADYKGFEIVAGWYVTRGEYNRKTGGYDENRRLIYGLRDPETGLGWALNPNFEVGDKTPLLSVYRSADGIMRNISNTLATARIELQESHADIAKLDALRVRKFDQQDEIDQVRRDLSATMARLQSQNRTGDDALEVKIGAAEEKLARLSGPTHVNILQTQREQNKWTPAVYLRQLEKWIAESEGRETADDTAADTGTPEHDAFVERVGAENIAKQRQINQLETRYARLFGRSSLELLRDAADELTIDQWQELAGRVAEGEDINNVETLAPVTAREATDLVLRYTFAKEEYGEKKPLPRGQIRRSEDERQKAFFARSASAISAPPSRLGVEDFRAATAAAGITDPTLARILKTDARSGKVSASPHADAPAWAQLAEVQGQGQASAAEVNDQTQTAAFKRWFGNSKVVDYRGTPLVVYHGTPDGRFLKETGVFKTWHQRYSNMLTKEARTEADANAGFFFAKDRSTASSYADDRRAFDYQNSVPAVAATYLKIENPLIIDWHGRPWRGGKMSRDYPISDAKKRGYDGMIITNVIDDYNVKGSRPTNVYVAFSSEQIKSATDNRGTFDPANPDIRYMRSPSTGEIRAVTVGDKTHFFLDRYSNQAELLGDIREEAGHRLINALGGDAWKMIGTRTYRGQWGHIVDEIKRNYGLQPGTEAFNHEVAAKMYRDGLHDAPLWRRFLDAIVAATRRSARKLGINLGTSDAELRNFLNSIIKQRMEAEDSSRQGAKAQSTTLGGLASLRDTPLPLAASRGDSEEASRKGATSQSLREQAAADYAAKIAAKKPSFSRGESGEEKPDERPEAQPPAPAPSVPPSAPLRAEMSDEQRKAFVNAAYIGARAKLKGEIMRHVSDIDELHDLVHEAANKPTIEQRVVAGLKVARVATHLGRQVATRSARDAIIKQLYDSATDALEGRKGAEIPEDELPKTIRGLIGAAFKLGKQQGIEVGQKYLPDAAAGALDARLKGLRVARRDKREQVLRADQMRLENFAQDLAEATARPGTGATLPPENTVRQDVLAKLSSMYGQKWVEHLKTTAGHDAANIVKALRATIDETLGQQWAEDIVRLISNKDHHRQQLSTLSFAGEKSPRERFDDLMAKFEIPAEKLNLLIEKLERRKLMRDLAKAGKVSPEDQKKHDEAEQGAAVGVARYLAGLTADQIREFHDDLAQLVADSDNLKFAVISGRKVSREANNAAIQQELERGRVVYTQGMNRREKPPLGSGRITGLNDNLRTLGMRATGGLDRGVLAHVTYHAPVAAEDAAAQLIHQRREAFYDAAHRYLLNAGAMPDSRPWHPISPLVEKVKVDNALNRLAGERFDVQLGTGDGRRSLKMNKAEIMDLWNTIKDPENADELARAGVNSVVDAAHPDYSARFESTEDAVSQIQALGMRFLSDGERRLADWMHSDANAEALRDALNATSRRMTGRDLFNSQSWWGRMRDRSTSALPQNTDEMLADLRGGLPSFDNQGWTKGRVRNRLDILYSNAFSKYLQHVDDTSRYIHMAGVMVDAADALRSNKGALVDRLGERGWQDMLHTYYRMAGLERNKPSGGEWFKRNAAVSILWYRLSSLLKDRWGTTAMTPFWLASKVDAKTAVRFMFDPRLYLPGKLFWSPKAVRDGFEDLVNGSGYFGKRWVDNATSVFASRYGAGDSESQNAASVIFKAAQQFGMAPHAEAEAKASVIAYMQMRAAGMDKNTAIKRTEELTRNLQPPSSAADQTRIYRGSRDNLMAWAFNPFSGPTSAMANWVHGSFLKYRGATTPAEKKQAGKELLFAIGGIMANAAVAGGVTAGLAKLRMGTDVEEPEDKETAREMRELATLGSDIFNSLLPGAGIPFQAAGKFATFGGIESPDMFNRLITDLGQSSHRLIKAIADEGLDTEDPRNQRAMLRLADGISQIFGLPGVSAAIDAAKVGTGILTGQPLIPPYEPAGRQTYRNPLAPPAERHPAGLR